MKGDLHANDKGLGYLKSDPDHTYGWNVPRPLKKDAIIMFAHTLSKLFVGETVATTNKYNSTDRDWRFLVRYNTDAIYRYCPCIPFAKLSEIPTHFKGTNVHAIVRNYPQLYLTEYQMMTKSISKIKI